MGSLPFAFSVHHFINSVGADAGFASIIGLAILILLYFAQARETASLRNHAQEAAQRIQELEARIAQSGRVQPQASGAQAVGGTGAGAVGAAAGAGAAGAAVAGQPASGPARPQAAPGRAAAAVATAPPGRFAAVGAPAAPAGVGAPALTAATKLIPTAAPGAASPVALAPSQEREQPPDATVIGAGPVSPPATVAGAGAGRSAEGAAVGTAGGAVAGAAVAGAGAVASGAGNGATQAPVAPRPVSAPTGAHTPPPRVQIRPGGAAAARRPVPPPRPRGPQEAGTSGVPRVLLALLGVLLLGGVIVALVVLTSNSGNSTPASASTSTTNAVGRHRTGTRRTAGVAPSSVTVAVLNGTATAGLAHRVSLHLNGTGFKQGTVATATDQTRTTTTVAYLPGYRRDAAAVASSLKLSSSAVQPVDQPTQAVACPPPTACTANVVVTVGSDLTNVQ